MPELPEVEVLRTDLARSWRGLRIRSVLTDGSARFADAALAEGCRVLDVSRRGKFLLIDFSNGVRLAVHLGMSGSVRLERAVPLGKFRAAWVSSRAVVVLRDPRGFGLVRQVPVSGPSGLGLLDRLGPEPFAEEFSAQWVRRWCGAPGPAVKARLLEQRMVAGVGNYVADESCFRAGVAPQASGLSLRRCARLRDAVVDVVSESISAGGVSVRDYVHLDGGRGSFAGLLRVYGRGGLPCVSCGAALCSAVVAGRGTVWCVRCQRL